MQDNPNTDHLTGHSLVDCEDWHLAFAPYQDRPDAALRLGFNLAKLRMHLDRQMIKYKPAMDTLDHAMEILFPYTSFHETSFDLFIRLTEGDLTNDEEQMLSALGIDF